MGCFGKLQNIIAHANNHGRYGRSIGWQEERSLLVGSRTHHYAAFLIISCGRSEGVPLQLSAPQATEVAIDLSVIVLEDTRVDTERTADGMGLWNEGAFGSVGYSHTEVEHTVGVFGGEDEVVFAILLHYIIVPHLTLGPRYLLYIEYHAVVCHFAILHVGQREYVVVFHLEMASVVIESLTAVTVVAGEDVKAVAKHIGRRVSHIVTREKISGSFHNVVILLLVIVSLFNFAVNFVNHFVTQFIFRNDEHGQQ